MKATKRLHSVRARRVDQAEAEAAAKRPVIIERSGDTWFVKYATRRRFQKHLAAQFTVADHTREFVEQWIVSQPGIILAP